MQKLEKILAEIDIKIAGSMGKKREGLLEAREIIRKHMDDGWIPVEERLPKESEYMGGDYRGVPWAKRLEIAYMADTVEYAHGYYDGYKWFNRRHEEIKNAMAWKIHEPYRRERPAWQEALLHTFLGGDTCGQKNTKAIPSHKAGAEAD